MAELEPFEMRLQSALRRYLADAPVEVDAAGVTRRVTAEGPGRRILPEFRPFGLSPALAWLLLALFLAAALVGSLLVAGSQRRPLPAIVPPAVGVEACPPGSTPDEPGPVGQARPAGGDIRMAFDRESGRIVAFGSAPSAAWGPWTFDVCTNTWSRPDSTFGPYRGSPSDIVSSVYHAGASVTLVLSSDGTLWTPDHTRNAWGNPTYWWEVSHTPESVRFGGRLVYDPVSRLVYVQQISSGDTAAPPQRLWTYDVETDTWDEVLQTGLIPRGTSGDHLLLAYDTAVDRIVAVQSHPNRPFTSQFDPRTAVWTASIETTPTFNTGFFGSGGEIAYDEAHGRTIVFSDGFLAAYDTTADRWETLVTEPSGPDGFRLGPQARLGHSMVYDPVNDRLVVAGGQYRTADGWVRADDVWAFDPATKEWIQLLAPSRIERYDTATEAWQPVPKDSQP